MNREVRCHYCSCKPSQFTILICDHVICSECLWNDMEENGGAISTIKCACGIKTCFNNSSTTSTVSRSSVKMHENSHRVQKQSLFKSPKETKSRLMKTQTVKMDESSFFEKPSIKINDNFGITTNFQKNFTDSRTTVSRFSKDLSNQIKFIEIQFGKSLQEAKKNYQAVVKKLMDNFQSFIKGIKYFCLQQIPQVESQDFNNFSKLINKKYEKTLGKRLKCINQTFIEMISSFNIEQGRESRLTALQSKQKQNNNGFLSPNCKYYKQNQRLLQQIQQLKEEKKIGKKTIAKKNLKENYKFF